MIHIFKTFIFLLSIAFFCSSCFYDNEEALFPELPGTCDTTLVSYSENVVPIIIQNCLLCHSNLAAPSLGNNMKLESFSDFSANSSDVLRAIKHDPSLSPMPKGGGKLNSCNISIIEAWIDQGKLEN